MPLAAGGGTGGTLPRGWARSTTAVLLAAPCSAPISAGKAGGSRGRLGGGDEQLDEVLGSCVRCGWAAARSRGPAA